MESLFRTGLAALLLLACTPAMAEAQDFEAGALVIRHPWTRATPDGAQVAGGYVTIINHGPAADTLTGGSLEVATRFEVHDMSIQGGVMTMRPAGPLSVPPGGSVMLSPSGTHIMFTGLKRGLKKGEVVGGTLVFVRAGVVPVQFSVESIGARQPAGTSMPTMKMD